MDKEQFLKTIGELVRLQTYQCYKEKCLKRDVRQQNKLVKLLAKAFKIELSDEETLLLFEEMNLWDIQPQFIIDTLKLKPTS